MAVVVLGQDRSEVELKVRAEERLRVPNWFREAMLLGYALIASLLRFFWIPQKNILRWTRGARQNRGEIIYRSQQISSYRLINANVLVGFNQPFNEQFQSAHNIPHLAFCISTLDAVALGCTTQTTVSLPISKKFVIQPFDSIILRFDNDQ